MRLSLKDEIVKTAKELFNEQGYRNVSMRNIADTLGISVGNLTYHFKKKEELIEAAVLEQHKGYRAPLAVDTLEGFDDLFRNISIHQKNNAYYFRHYTQLAQISEKIYKNQLVVVKNLYLALRGSFSNLKAKGFLEPEEIDGQFEQLIQALMIVNIYWIPQSGLTQMHFYEESPLDCIWNMVYPMLTADGKRVYKEMKREQKSL